jgi:hypothetical protein
VQFDDILGKPLLRGEEPVPSKVEGIWASRANRGPRHARFWRDGVGDVSRSFATHDRAFGSLPAKLHHYRTKSRIAITSAAE